eukprot:GFYU01000335.1.p1 GENE.GFYU01000335.1~~GFYU01000335.1.p1  ORF type:complete len:641 (+),score=64.42 GFYU01000335.1:212-2134(+)
MSTLPIVASLLAALVGTSAHKCIHDELAAEYTPVSTTQEYFPVSHRIKTHTLEKKESSLPGHFQDGVGPEVFQVANLRIAFDTTYLDPTNDHHSCGAAGQDVEVAKIPHTCEERDILSSDSHQYLVDKLLPKAKEWFEKTLDVKYRAEGGLRLDGMKCHDLPIPQIYTAKAVDADMVIFVTSRPAIDTLAWATYCQENKYGQPVAGILNVRPYELAQGSELQHHLIGEIRHQISHILGFSKHKFRDFRTASNPDVRLGEQAIFAISEYNGHPVRTMTTPRVREFVRQHFGCEDLVGAELEDVLGGGLSSHWEARLFIDEFMTTFNTEVLFRPRYSALTLSLLEDSGWYTVSSSFHNDLIDDLQWGSKQGCSFAYGDCRHWKQPGTFCAKESEESCSYDRRAKATCNLGEWPEIPAWAQYFVGYPHMGGLHKNADFCPYYYARAKDYCDSEENGETEAKIFGEEYGTTSKCFMSSLLDISIGGESFPQHRPRCHKTRCASGSTHTSFNHKLEVRIGDKWHECPQEGGRLTFDDIEGYNWTGEITGKYVGDFICPPVDEVCDNFVKPDFSTFFANPAPVHENAEGVRMTTRKTSSQHTMMGQQIMLGLAVLATLVLAVMGLTAWFRRRTISDRSSPEVEITV